MSPYGAEICGNNNNNDEAANEKDLLELTPIDIDVDIASQQFPVKDASVLKITTVDTKPKFNIFSAFQTQIGLVLANLIGANPLDTLRIQPKNGWVLNQAWLQQRDAAYPTDLVIANMSPDTLSDLVARSRSGDKVKHLDPFTKLVFLRLKAMRIEDFRQNISPVKDQFLPRKVLNKKEALGILVMPDYEEEAGYSTSQRPVLAWSSKYLPLISWLPYHSPTTALIKRFVKGLAVKTISWFLNVLPLFDEDDPVFFESNEEAAVYVDGATKKYLPESTARFGVVNPPKHVDGDVTQFVLTGYGQWLLVAINKEGNWPQREASSSCIPPRGAIGVIDKSSLAKFEVRAGYERYGSALFLGEKWEPVGVWIEDDKHLYTPELSSRDEWEFALWHVKVTLTYYSFATSHLVEIHFIVSNTMVTATREQLSPEHPVRKLMWPFLHNSITINRTAIDTLTPLKGGVTRVGAQTPESMHEYCYELTEAWQYKTFEEHLRSKGEFLGSAKLNELPYVEDGRALWRILHTWISGMLTVYYAPDHNDTCTPRGGPIGKRSRVLLDDHELVAFWEAADHVAFTSESGMRFGLPKQLTHSNLVDFLTHHIFYSSAVHEMIASVALDVMLPGCTGGRINDRRHFGTVAGGRLPQSPVQDIFRFIPTLITTTTVSMPMLIPEIRRIALAFPVEQPGRIHSLECADELEKLADRIEADIMPGGRREKTPFGAFNPRCLEASVSL